MIETKTEFQERGGRMTFHLTGFDAFARTVKPIGNGAYVPVPRKYLGKRVKVILMEE